MYLSVRSWDYTWPSHVGKRHGLTWQWLPRATSKCGRFKNALFDFILTTIIYITIEFSVSTTRDGFCLLPSHVLCHQVGGESIVTYRQIHLEHGWWLGASFLRISMHLAGKVCSGMFRIPTGSPLIGTREYAFVWNCTARRGKNNSWWHRWTSRYTSLCIMQPVRPKGKNAFLNVLLQDVKLLACSSQLLPERHSHRASIYMCWNWLCASTRNGMDQWTTKDAWRFWSGRVCFWL